MFRTQSYGVHLDVLRPASLEQLADLLESRRDFYHVLHLDVPLCHSEHGEDLAFEDTQGNLRLVTGRQLANVLEPFL